MDDYNALKKLPKDILIKLLLEVKKLEEKEKKDWGNNILSEFNFGLCSVENCFRTYPIDQDTRCAKCRKDFEGMCWSHLRKKYVNCRNSDDCCIFDTCHDCGCYCEDK